MMALVDSKYPHPVLIVLSIILIHKWLPGKILYIKIGFLGTAWLFTAQVEPFEYHQINFHTYLAKSHSNKLLFPNIIEVGGTSQLFKLYYSILQNNKKYL